MDRRTFMGATLAVSALAAGVARAAETQATPLAASQPPQPEMIMAAPENRFPAGLKIAPQYYPVSVSVRRDLEPGTIIVLSNQHFLYYIVEKGIALRYGVAVGKAELVFRGEAVVGRKVEWPSWKPTPEMVERNPGAYAKYAEKGMEGGPKNPLGARAIYLFQDGRDTAIRIHGTVEPNSIGHSVSNGCLRMVNEHVIDLYNRVQMGAKVMVF